MFDQRTFCIGLNKTGTKSLACAFEMLGLRALHDSSRATAAIERASAQGLPLLTDIDAFDCYTDAPFYRWYRQLDAQYPGSRFIMNTRDTEAWVRSRINHDQRWNTRRRAVEDPPRPCDREHLIAFKQRKEREIITYFADMPERFMVLDICGGQGWQELCGFVGLPLPRTSNDSVPPFPFENRRLS